MESATEVLKRNTGDSSITKCSSEERKSIPEPTLLSHKLSTSPVNTQESDGSPVRFSLASLLPKIRFLLPLCSQRWRLVHELLHATELSAPEYMPVITVDRRVPLIERHANTGSSVFLQVNHELKKEKLHFRYVLFSFCIVNDKVFHNLNTQNQQPPIVRILTVTFLESLKFNSCD